MGRKRILVFLLLSCLILSSCVNGTIPITTETSSVVNETISTEIETEEKPQEEITTQVTQNEENQNLYHFDMTISRVEVDGKFYECYVNRKLLFDGVEVPYEEFLSYVGPYDEYVTLFYDDRSGVFGIADTVAFAIRYACENDIEYIDFPIEYDAYTLEAAWEYARMSFPNLPLDTGLSEFQIGRDGYYSLHFTKVLRDVASSPETLEVAKDIVEGMPSSCETQAQKAFYLYDWVCKNVVYDMYHISGKEGVVNCAAQSAYGALVEKRAVCDGIAGAIQLLYSVAGIECGKVDSFDYKGGVGHVWNVAEIDGEIWDFDATWDICRYYYDKGDTVTEEKGLGFYSWFGVERTAKTVQLDINDMMAEFGVFTEEAYSDSSPVLLSYDIVISDNEKTGDLTMYFKGQETQEFPYRYIIEKTEMGGVVSIKCNNSFDLANIWADLTDSSSYIIDGESCLGYPDTELLSIIVYPVDYFSD